MPSRDGRRYVNIKFPLNSNYGAKYSVEGVEYNNMQISVYGFLHKDFTIKFIHKINLLKLLFFYLITKQTNIFTPKQIFLTDHRIRNIYVFVNL